MEKERIRVWDRIKMRGLKNAGLVEISQNPKSGDYVLVMSKGIKRKWLMFNFPVDMWRVKCSKEEVSPVINLFLNESILAK